MLVCVCYALFCTRDRGCSAHPASPAPSSYGETLCKARANHAARLLTRIWRSKIEPNSHHVIASEAKQSISLCKERMDCFVADAPRNDVEGAEYDSSQHGGQSAACPPCQ